MSLRTASQCLRAVALAVVVTACEGGDREGRIELEVRESSDLDVTAHPSRPELVFTLLGSLWTVPEEGGTARRLTAPEERARHPAWSPVGDRLAYVARAGSRHAIRVRAGDEEAAPPLFESASPISGLAWAPTGDRIVFLVGSNGTCEIRVVAISASLPATSVPWAGDRDCDSELAWTGDGVVFSGREEPEGPDTGLGLWRISQAGGRAVPLVEGPGDQRSPVAARDGGFLYLARNGGETDLRRHPEGTVVAKGLPPDAGRPAIRGGSDAPVVLPADGKLWRISPSGDHDAVSWRAVVNLREPAFRRTPPDVSLSETVPARGILAPRISPDGRRVAFSAMGDVWVADLDPAGGRPRPVVTGPAEETMPAWSPDGTWLAYASNIGGDFDLWIIGVDGTGRLRLTDLEGDEREPAWAPEGDRIAFSYFDNATTDLFLVRSASGETTRLTRHAAWNWDLSPAWSPDGERLAFLRRTPERSTPHIAVLRPEEPAGEVLSLEYSGERDALPATALAWSPTGELVYRQGGVLRTGRWSRDGPVITEDRSTGEARAFHPSFDRTGRHLLYLSTDGLRLRAWPTGEERRIPLPLQVPPRAVPPPLIVRNVRLVDGTGRAPEGPVEIRIEGGRIAEIRRSEDPGAPDEIWRRDAEVIDGSGLTALPGLVDMHTHLFHYGMRAYLGSGVTTVRDVGFESHLIASRWEGVRSGRLAGPRIVYAGEFLDGPGGPWMGNFVVTVVTPEQVRAEVARLADFGASWIKTYVSMPPELRRAAIEAAHRFGIPATQHEIHPALAFGADGVEHVREGWNQDLRAVLTASEAWLVPTLDVGSGSFIYLRDHPEVWSAPDVTGLLPGYVRTSFRRAVEGADPVRVAEVRNRHAARLEVVRKLREEGGRMVVGTDPTNPFVLFGIGVHWELEHMVEAGFEPLEAIHLATGAAARALGLERELGTIEEGKLADLVLVENDPVADIRNTRRIRWVVFGGDPLRPGDLHPEGSGNPGTRRE